MITGYLLAVVLCAALIVVLFALLRTRRIREKYAGLWLVIALGVIVLAVLPQIAFWLADVLNVATQANLLFAVAFAVLLGICIYLSTEISSLEEENRTIAEEVALLRLEVRRARAAAQPGAPEEGDGNGDAAPPLLASPGD